MSYNAFADYINKTLESGGFKYRITTNDILREVFKDSFTWWVLIVRIIAIVDVGTVEEGRKIKMYINNIKNDLEASLVPVDSHHVNICRTSKIFLRE